MLMIFFSGVIVSIHFLFSIVFHIQNFEDRFTFSAREVSTCRRYAYLLGVNASPNFCIRDIIFPLYNNTGFPKWHLSVSRWIKAKWFILFHLVRTTTTTTTSTTTFNTCKRCFHDPNSVLIRITLHYFYRHWSPLEYNWYTSRGYRFTGK